MATMADLRIRWVIACARRARALATGDLDAALVENKRIDLLLDQWPTAQQNVLPAPAG